MVFTATCETAAAFEGCRVLSPELDGWLSVHCALSLTPGFRRADRCEEEDAVRRNGQRVVAERARCALHCGTQYEQAAGWLGNTECGTLSGCRRSCNVAPGCLPGVLCVAPSLGGRVRVDRAGCALWL